MAWILNKEYQKILLVTMNVWVQESLESELRLKSYEGLKLKDLKIIKINKAGT
jgi:hypothetical protein